MVITSEIKVSPGSSLANLFPELPIIICFLPTLVLAAHYPGVKPPKLDLAVDSLFVILNSFTQSISHQKILFLRRKSQHVLAAHPSLCPEPDDTEWTACFQVAICTSAFPNWTMNDSVNKGKEVTHSFVDFFMMQLKMRLGISLSVLALVYHCFLGCNPGMVTCFIALRWMPVFILIFRVLIQAFQFVVSYLLNFLWCGSDFDIINYTKKPITPQFMSRGL